DLELLVNQPFELDVRAIDPDNDFLVVSLFRNVFFDNFEFINGEGQGEATGVMRWTPSCSLLGSNFSPRDYNVSFLAQDLRCPNPEADTIEVTFTLREPLEGEVAFLPANAFSPNGDGINEVFTLTGLDIQERNLPPDLCENTFQYIRIFDRTGKQVYSSNERSFSWTGDGLTSGTYFYWIKYTSTEYKGYVTMVY
ncbi:MAG: gliding motility-associated C-terminal domain-containing protein, partial [Bacteroidota bacterium]